MNVSELKTDRSLDTLIAKNVMKWKLSKNREYWMDGRMVLYKCSAWSPSTKINHAWQVMEQLNQNYNINFQLIPEKTGWHIKTVRFSIFGSKLDGGHSYSHSHEVPFRICRMALKELGIK